MNKKYLFYDNIVRGAGIGHTLACYNYGLNMALEKGLEYLPCETTPGHNLGPIGMERLLNLPLREVERNTILLEEPDAVEHIKYANDQIQTSKDFTLTRKMFREWYASGERSYNDMILRDSTDTANISMSIRRGDLTRAGPAHHMWARMRSNEWYVNALENIISKYKITNYRLLVFSDASIDSTHDGSWKERPGEFIDEFRNPVDINTVFKNHLNDFIYHPSNKTHERTADHFHNIVSSDYFIGSISGFSEIIRDIYYDGVCVLPD